MLPRRGVWLVVFWIAGPVSALAGVIVEPTLVQTVDGWDQWDFRIAGYSDADANPTPKWFGGVNSLSGISGLFLPTPGSYLSLGNVTTNAALSSTASHSFVNFGSSVAVVRTTTPAGVCSLDGTWFTSNKDERLRAGFAAGDEPDLSLLARVFVTHGGGINFAGLINSYNSIGLPTQFSAGRSDPVPDDPALVAFSGSNSIIHYTGESNGDLIADLDNGYLFDATSFSISNASPTEARTRDAALIRFLGKTDPDSRVIFSPGLSTGLLMPGEQQATQITYNESGLLNGAVMTGRIAVDTYNDRRTLSSDADAAHVRHEFKFYKRASAHIGDGQAPLVNAPGGNEISVYKGIWSVSDEGAGTVATLLSGGLASSWEFPAPKTVTMAWDARNASAPLTAATPTAAISDSLRLAGISRSGVAIQLSYDPALLASDEALLALAGNIQISALDPATGEWVEAELLNLPSDVFQVPRVLHNVQAAWPGPFAGFADDNGYDLLPIVGSTGIDVQNHVVWAIVNYDGTFAVTIPQQWLNAAVPEPSSWILTAIGVAILCRQRVRRVFSRG